MTVKEGNLRRGTPLCVERRGQKDPATGLQAYLDIGRVASLEINRKAVDVAKQGQSASVKIDAVELDRFAQGVLPGGVREERLGFVGAAEEAVWGDLIVVVWSVESWCCEMAGTCKLQRSRNRVSIEPRGSSHAKFTWSSADLSTSATWQDVEEFFIPRASELAAERARAARLTRSDSTASLPLRQRSYKRRR